jgi:hypothetical protein
VLVRRVADGDDVVAERPEQVLADDAHGSPGEFDAGGHAADVAADQRDVRRFDGGQGRRAPSTT